MRARLIDGALVLATALLMVHGAWTLRTSLVASGRGTQPRAAASSAKPVAIGQTIRSLDLSQVNTSEFILALFFRQECGFCQASLPFYTELSQLRDSFGGRLRLIVAGPDEARGLREFLLKNDVAPDHIQSLPLASAGVSGTPTLALLDQRGIVQQLWVGQLQPKEQDEVRALLRRAFPTAAH